LFNTRETRNAARRSREKRAIRRTARVNDMRKTSKRRLWKAAGRKMMVRFAG
jgi:hypothetical protein